VLLITDGIDNDVADKLHDAVRKLVAGGYRLSVLGVGTAAGAPGTSDVPCMPSGTS